MARRATRAVTIVAVLAAFGIGYAVVPRHADLRGFDPVRMGEAEAAMWRHYYDKRYLALFGDLYSVSRREYGFSPWDSARIAAAAARAARAFQPSTSRAEAEVALPQLVVYFGLLAGAAPVPIDVAETARTELAWWQARREAVGPEAYGLIIARVSTLLYGVDGEAVRHAGVLRARAMEDRDSHADGIAEADWSRIAGELVASYRLLKDALPAGARP